VIGRKLIVSSTAKVWKRLVFARNGKMLALARTRSHTGLGNDGNVDKTLGLSRTSNPSPASQRLQGNISSGRAVARSNLNHYIVYLTLATNFWPIHPPIFDPQALHHNHRRLALSSLQHTSTCVGRNKQPYIGTIIDCTMPSDREQLLEMGFDLEKVDIALKKTGGCK
jgi:hypothetical protein